VLNKVVLMQQLQAAGQTLFKDFSDEFTIARQSWQRILDDPTFIYKIRQITTPWLVPDWHEQLSQAIPVSYNCEPYVVLAVDGSQVYPDRHQGTSCFLINIGFVTLAYQAPSFKAVQFESRPYVFGVEQDTYEVGMQSPEVVNCKRQELELKTGLEQSAIIKAALPDDTPFLFLFDGSLIFWHLEAQEAHLKELFLNTYISLLDQLYQLQVLCAGYISLPKSKELVNLIRIELCKFKIDGCKELHAVDHVVDAHVAAFYLTCYSRSIVFKSNATIGACYPNHLKPYFFYVDVGQEIVRIEIPAWIARDEKKVSSVAAMVVNQAVKGMGYPVALAESHEQAVIKGPDREFFYQLLSKLAFERKQHCILSQKSIKKRGIGI